MEYNIQASTKFIPPKHEFIWRDLKLDSISSDIYAIVLGFGVWTGKYSDFVEITLASESVIKRRISNMVKNNILTKITLSITGGATRAILVCNYTKDGLRSEYEIKALLDIGLENIDKYYKAKSINIKTKKNSKNNVKKHIKNSDLDLSNDIVITEELYRQLDI